MTSTGEGGLTAAQRTVLERFNPDVQLTLMAMPRGEAERRCYFGGAPTLAALSKDYGRQTASAWLTVQLGSLEAYAGVKEKLSPSQTKELAYMITGRFWYLKVSELMLFFIKLKSGEYGKFYGAVDPMAVMEALGKFTEDRGRAYDRHEQEQCKAEADASLREGIIATRQRMLQLKQQKDNGNN